MIVVYDNVWAKVVSPLTDDERQEIREILGCLSEGYQYSTLYQEGKWDGIKTFFRWGKFPTGLMHILKEAKSDTVFKDHRPPNQSQNNPLTIVNAKIRDYQQEALDVFLENERGIIRLATRSGKTFIAAAAAQIMGKRSLFITHLLKLLRQASKLYKKHFSIKCGTIGNNTWQPAYATMATFQTLARRLKNNDKETINFLRSIEYVIFDEVHRASKDYQLISRNLPNARWRMGLSATACLTNRYNALASQSMTGPIIYEIPLVQLVKEKRVAKPTVYFLDIPNKVKIPRGQWKNWHTVYRICIVNFDIRNEIILEISKELKNDKERVLIIVEQITHGQTLEAMLRDFANVKFVSGKHGVDEQERAIELLQARKLDVLIATKIFDMGVDIPTLDSLILASGGKSPISVYQKFGRPMTWTTSKDICKIFDFIDRSHPDLLEHSMARKGIVESDPAFEVKVIKLKER